MKSLQPECHVAVDHGEIAYHAFGTGPVLLFLNGLGADWRGLRHQVTHFSTRYRCLVWNYRGLYRDEAMDGSAPRSIADHARDGLAILEQEGVQRAVLVGWSLGVQVALQMFATAPHVVSMLLLVGGGARAPWGLAPEAGPIRRLYPRAFDLLARAPSLVESLLRAGGSSPEAFTWARRIGLLGRGADPELFAEVTRSFAALRVDAALATLNEMARVDLSRTLPLIDVPTLVIGGDRDPFVSRAALERLVHRIAGAEYLLLPGAGHYVLLDHAQHVNLRIDKFFAERGFSGQPGTLSLHPK
jgi:pimeloyl-ACP methyl ester carboxylesterase